MQAYRPWPSLHSVLIFFISMARAYTGFALIDAYCIVCRNKEKQLAYVGIGIIQSAM